MLAGLHTPKVRRALTFQLQGIYDELALTSLHTARKNGQTQSTALPVLGALVAFVVKSGGSEGHSGLTT